MPFIDAEVPNVSRREVEEPAGASAWSGETLRTESQWEDLREAWQELARQSQAFYLSYPWLRNWWDRYGQGNLNLGVVRRGQRVVALAPLRRRRLWRWGLPARAIENLFNAHACRSDFAVLEGAEEALGHLLDLLELEPWDVVRLREIPQESRLLEALPALCRRRGLSLRTREALFSPYIVVSGDWDSFLGGRGRRFRKQLRNKANRMRASGRQMEFGCLSTVSEIEAALPEVMEVALKSWSGERGSSIASPDNRGFYEGVIRGFAGSNQVRIWTLRLDGTLAAFEIHLQWERTVIPIKACYDPAFADLSPGSILEEHALKAIFGVGGYDVYDLLGSADPYKLQWTDRVRVHYEVFLFNRRPLSRLLEALEFGLRPRLGALKRRLQRRPEPQGEVA